MHIDLIRTFIQVAKSRHFRKASDQLFITQSAVSARIKQLEQNLGTKLFVRNKHDVSLTTAGIRFLAHAEKLMTSWNKACHEVMLPESIESSLMIGATDTIWSVFLTDWVADIQSKHNDLAVWAELHTSKSLMPSLIDGMLDVAVMFDVPALPSLYVRELPDITFIMVSSQPNLSVDKALESNFISIDWGEAFAAVFAQDFGGPIVTTRHTSVGGVALDLMLKAGGSAYLPRQMVEESMQAGKLFAVKGAPQMKRPMYAACLQEVAQDELMIELINSMGHFHL